MFENVYNALDRTIVGITNYSPTSQLKKGLAPSNIPWEERIPDVNKLSDVMWILWVKEVNEALQDGSTTAAGDLKYIFKHHIITVGLLGYLTACHSLLWLCALPEVYC